MQLLRPVWKAASILMTVAMNIRLRTHHGMTHQKDWNPWILLHQMLHPEFHVTQLFPPASLSIRRISAFMILVQRCPPESSPVKRKDSNATLGEPRENAFVPPNVLAKAVHEEEDSVGLLGCVGACVELVVAWASEPSFGVWLSRHCGVSMYLKLVELVGGFSRWSKGRDRELLSRVVLHSRHRHTKVSCGSAPCFPQCFFSRRSIFRYRECRQCADANRDSYKCSASRNLRKRDPDWP